MTPFIVRGVPHSLSKDAWWMAADAMSGVGHNPPQPREKVAMEPLFALLVLIACADVMLWQVFPGIGLPIFFSSVACAAHVFCFRVVPAKTAAKAWAILIVALIPSIDLVQALSLAFALGGLMAFVGIMMGDAGKAALWAAVRFPVIGTMNTIVSAQSLGMQPSQSSAMLASLRDWIIPGVLGVVFICLMVVANPLFDQWLTDLFVGKSVPLPSIDQVIFWIILVPFIWPFLRLANMRKRLLHPRPDVQEFAPVWFLNGRVVMRALVMFNVIFAMQSVTDLTILWGQVALPDGLTFAQYAHRGAYPLLAAALLAGGFALLAQPFLAGRLVMRALLLLWVGQTALLVASSMLRLDLYIEAYNLTRLRFAAFIWMAVIAGGLLLMMWQILRGYGPGWLILRASELGIITLFVCSLINVDGFVGRHILAGNVDTMDKRYLCSLGEGVVPAIAAFEEKNGRINCKGYNSKVPSLAIPTDWREWGYRNARLQTKLAEIEGATQ